MRIDHGVGYVRSPIDRPPISRVSARDPAFDMFEMVIDGSPASVGRLAEISIIIVHHKTLALVTFAPIKS